MLIISPSCKKKKKTQWLSNILLIQTDNSLTTERLKFQNFNRETSRARESGIPWQIHSFTDVQTLLGNPPYPRGEGYAPLSIII